MVALGEVAAPRLLLLAPPPLPHLEGGRQGRVEVQALVLDDFAHNGEPVAVAIVSVFLSSPDFEIHLLAMDIGIMSTNLLGLALALFYTKKVELYSELTPDNIPNLPSFGPEVSQT